ncbi:MAG TPA: folylpolyglutamate synthase/dihydrofolate synthase family protein [Methylomirabilota bacterium]|jgi:dihydrofolate synthase/folylpolyglutamate synthase|nr:folylpolyglutamate synthase/dihydrofolate synthase family protein [Methylomirabilota bacterium]
MTYGEAVARILALRGGEITGMRPGLERIETLLGAIGNPERAFRIVQIGGTNGKGSISAMLAAILQAAGTRVGLYTSPHLCGFSERIRVNGRPIPEADVVDGVEAIGTLVARLDATMFEATTALALDHFAREGVELAVLEVGLGGRLDATTVGEPVVEILSRIDYDHQAYLGDTLEAIATEKAAIIRSGIALTARQDPEAERVLLRRAAEVGVPLWIEGRDLHARVRGFTLEGQRLDLTGPGWRLEDVGCRLLGVFQPVNALLAVAAARELGAGEHAIRGGLGTVQWPGRFQILQRDPVVILDGAHNPAGARALAASLAAYFPGQPVTLVLGISADKDQTGILAALAPLASRLILTAYSSPRAASPTALRAAVPSTAARVEIAGSLTEALSLALAKPSTPVVCVAGSLYLIGEVLAQAREKQDILCRPGVRW